MRDVDGLALGIVETVHGVDAREHAESVDANGGKEELKSKLPSFKVLQLISFRLKILI